MPLTQGQIEKKLTNEDPDELLHLWRTEQGAEKRRDLNLISAIIPFPQDAALRVLDLSSGPYDVGRAIRARYPNSHIDCVDRDIFLISMCICINRREGVPGQNLVRDRATLLLLDDKLIPNHRDPTLSSCVYDSATRVQLLGSSW
jgi:hypothetical protein